MQPPDKSISKNALTAVLSYELMRLENLSMNEQMLAASELSTTIQTIKIGPKSDQDFFEHQAKFYKSVKSELIARGSFHARTTKSIVASIMECVCKAATIDGLQDVLITSVKNWIRGSATKI